MSVNGFKGRKIGFTWDGSPIPGVREKNIQFGGEPVDVSDDDSEGIRQQLEEMGEVSLDLSISGVTKSKVLALLAGQVDRSGEAVLTYPNGLVITCPMVMTTYSDTGPYNDATTFEAEFQNYDVFTVSETTT